MFKLIEYIKIFDLLSFEDYDNINDVEQWKNGLLKVSEDNWAELSEGEYYFYEIIGCNVFTEEGEELGVVTEILTPGANDVWVVKEKAEKNF